MEEKEGIPRHKNTGCTKVWRLERAQRCLRIRSRLVGCESVSQVRVQQVAESMSQGLL